MSQQMMFCCRVRKGEAGVGCSGVGVGLFDAAATEAGWSAGSAIRITVIAKGGEGQQGAGGRGL